MADVGVNRVWSGSTHWRRINRFVGSYGWMAADAARGRPWLALGIVFFSTAAAVTQGLSVGILGFFAESIVNPEAGTAPIAGIIPRDGPILVVLLAASLFLALIGNSGFAWGSAKLSRELARDYHSATGSSVLRAFSQWRGGHEGYDRPFVTRLVMRNARVLGTATETLLGSVRLVFQTLVAMGIVLATEPLLTLGVAPLLLLLTPFVYKLGGDVRESSREFYESSFQGTSARVRSFVTDADAMQLYEQQPDVGARFGHDEGVARYFDLYDDIRLAGARAVFITSSFRSFLIVAVVSLAGYNVVNGAFSWGRLTIYVAALGYLLSSLQGLAETVTKLNRFFPQLDEYRTFLQRMAGQGSEAATLPAAVRLEFGTEHRSLSLAAGSVVAYAPCLPLGRLTATEALCPLAHASETAVDSWSALPFVMGVSDLPEDPGLHPWVNPQGEGSSEAALRDCRVAAAISSLHQQGGPVALVGSALLADASAALRSRVLKEFHDRILIIVLGNRWPDDVDVPVLVANSDGEIEDVVPFDGFRQQRAHAPDLHEEEEDMEE